MSYHYKMLAFGGAQWHQWRAEVAREGRQVTHCEAGHPCDAPSDLKHCKLLIIAHRFQAPATAPRARTPNQKIVTTLWASSALPPRSNLTRRAWAYITRAVDSGYIAPGGRGGRGGQGPCMRCPMQPSRANRGCKRASPIGGAASLSWEPHPRPALARAHALSHARDTSLPLPCTAPEPRRRRRGLCQPSWNSESSRPATVNPPT